MQVFFSDGKELAPEVKELDKSLKGKIKYLIDEKEITGKAGEVTIIHTFDDIKPKRVVLAGMGTSEKTYNQSTERQLCKIS